MRRLELPPNTAYKAAALNRLSYIPAKRVTGYDPVPPVWKTGMQPITPHAHCFLIWLSKCKQATGFEPVSPPWQGGILTVILRLHGGRKKCLFPSPGFQLYSPSPASGHGRGRTYGIAVNSRSLCQLSYVSK